MAAALDAVRSSTAPPEALNVVFADGRGERRGRIGVGGAPDPGRPGRVTSRSSCEAEPVHMHPDWDLGAMVRTMSDFNLIVAPVIDAEHDEILGVVTVDDVLELLLPTGLAARLRSNGGRGLDRWNRERKPISATPVARRPVAGPGLPVAPGSAAARRDPARPALTSAGSARPGAASHRTRRRAPRPGHDSDQLGWPLGTATGPPAASRLGARGPLGRYAWPTERQRGDACPTRRPAIESARAAVLDEAHLGDIQGAFGTIRAARSRHPAVLGGHGCSPCWPSWVPGSSSWSGDNDAGGVATYSQAGQNFGLTLLWTLPLLIPVLVVNQEMVVRLGAVTGVGHARLINERFGRFWGAFSVGDLFILNFLTIATEFIGVSLALDYFGISEYVSVPIAAVLLVAMTATGSFRRWERFMFVFIAVNFLVIPLAFFSHPSRRGLLQGPHHPGVQGGFTSTSVLLIIAIVGTTVAPWQLFFQQSNIVDKRITPRWINYERADTVLGSLITVFAACAADGRGGVGLRRYTVWPVTSPTPVVWPRGLQHYVGRAAGALFAIVLLNASIIGAASVTLSTSYAFGDVFGARHSLHRSWREAKFFYGAFSRHGGLCRDHRAHPGCTARAHHHRRPGARRCAPAQRHGVPTAALQRQGGARARGSTGPGSTWWPASSSPSSSMMSLVLMVTTLFSADRRHRAGRGAGAACWWWATSVPGRCSSSRVRRRPRRRSMPMEQAGHLADAGPQPARASDLVPGPAGRHVPAPWLPGGRGPAAPGQGHRARASTSRGPSAAGAGAGAPAAGRTDALIRSGRFAPKYLAGGVFGFYVPARPGLSMPSFGLKRHKVKGPPTPPPVPERIAPRPPGPGRPAHRLPRLPGQPALRRARASTPAI